MKKYKVLAADIDRTLRGDDRAFGPLSREAMQRLHADGVKIGLASGRPIWQNLKKHAEEWELGFPFDFLIGLNGGEIYDEHTGKTIKQNLLEPETIRYIIEQMEPTGCNPFVYREGYMLARWDDELLRASAARNKNESRVVKDLSELWSEPIGKLMYRTHSAEEMDSIVVPLARTIENETFFAFKTRVDLLEFQDRRNHKGNGVKAWCEANGYTMDDVIAFGDAENDLEMMRMAGYSVCLCNGMEENKRIADAVTEYPAGEDGFGRWILKHWYGEER